MPVTVGQDASKEHELGYYYYNPARSDAQNKINSAIKAATDGIVIIESGTYMISDPIYLVTGTKLRGTSSNPTTGTTIYGTYDTCSEVMAGSPVKTKSGYIMCVSISNCEIASINFLSDCDGPGEGKKRHCGGLDHKECIIISDSSYIAIHHCRESRWTYMDFCTIKSSHHINIYNNMLTIAHCGIYTIKSNNIHAYNNEIEVTTNSAFRIDGSDAGCEDVEYDHNLIYGYRNGISGQSACELQGKMNICSFHHNIVYDMDKCSSSWTVVQNLTGNGSFTAHDNVYWNCPGDKKGAIELGDDKKTNIKDPSNRSVQYWIDQKYGPQKKKLSDSVPEELSNMDESSVAAPLT